MAIVSVCKNKHEADVKVFLVSYKHEADLLYCEVKQKFDGKGDALWFFTDKDYEATVKIFWVEGRHEADIKVFKVDQKFEAKWVNSNKFVSRLG